mmetsp:Transcript_3803/g.12701  ORF Transcript_3803/g.12701 Transcript_3803/m.12701 type:complete len:202 (-) Transcript_3803:689-1294(-)
MRDRLRVRARDEQASQLRYQRLEHALPRRDGVPQNKRRDVREAIGADVRVEHARGEAHARGGIRVVRRVHDLHGETALLPGGPLRPEHRELHGEGVVPVGPDRHALRRLQLEVGQLLLQRAHRRGEADGGGGAHEGRLFLALLSPPADLLQHVPVHRLQSPAQRAPGELPLHPVGEALKWHHPERAAVARVLQLLPLPEGR